MTATDHTLVTAAVAIALSKTHLSSKTKIGLGLTGAFCLHLAMDCLPHFDPGNLGSSFLVWGTPAFWSAVPDFFLAGVAILYFLYRYRPRWLFGLMLILGVGQDVPVGLALGHYLDDQWWGWRWFFDAHKWAHEWWTTGYTPESIYWIHTRIGHVTNVAIAILAGFYIYQAWRKPKAAAAHVLTQDVVVAD